MWLVERGVHLVGMDTPSPDRDPHPAHYVLLGANMVIVENLTGLERIGRDVFELIVVPLPLRGPGGLARPCPGRFAASRFRVIGRRKVVSC